MLLAQDFRRQALVCARLADDCDDPRLAKRLRAMASDLLAKAENLKNCTAIAAVALHEVGGRGVTRPHNKKSLTEATTRSGADQGLYPATTLNSLSGPVRR